jgi:hypothetical protein
MLLLGFSIYKINIYVNKFFDVDEIREEKLEKYTINGNKYNHKIDYRIENGHYVGLYFCRKELKKSWNQVSNISYDSLDKKGNELKYTLIRYLTSKNLRKDSVGVSKLTYEDIKAIENGVPNYIYNNKFSLQSVIYKILWQYNNYKNTGNPNNNSLMQRYEYLKASINIISRNYIIGVGTGDLQLAFDNYYNRTN